MKLLNYWLIFYFSLVALLPKGDLYQLTTFDDLYLHFIEHKEEAKVNNKEFSLSEFLYEHFVVDSDHHNNNTEHDNLPLKEIVSSTSFFFMDSPAASISIKPIFHSSCIGFDDNLISNLYTQPVFHPPLL